MSRRSSVPAYTHHRSSGQARVRLDGRDVYLGPYGSTESRERYARIIAERAVEPVSDSKSASIAVADPDMTVGELVLRFYLHAKISYGERNKETYGLRDALRPVNELYGHARAREFGPKSLKVVRQHMINVQDLCRNEINRRISRIRRAFTWAESEELIPAGQCHALQTVTGLLKGRTEARESDSVKPVDQQAVETTLKFVAPPVAAIIQLQQLTGMRQGEVVIMRPLDIDRSGDVWLYRPATHKTAYRGTEKQVPLGPQAQAVIQPFLDRDPDAFLFSPIEAEAWRNDRRAVHYNPARKTKVYPSELKARERLKQARKSKVSKRPKRNLYDSDSYRRAVTYGIQKARKAGVEISFWHPHQLRHSCGTEVRRRYGIEAAQVMLGHTTANVTEIYAERNLKLAVSVAKEMG